MKDDCADDGAVRPVKEYAGGENVPVRRASSFWDFLLPPRTSRWRNRGREGDLGEIEWTRDTLHGSGLVIDFRGMNDKTFVALFVALGTKLYELQTGFAAMFILNTDRGSFTREDFLKVKGQVEASPEMKKLRRLLDTLRDPKEPVDFEKLLREFEGPVQ